MCKHWITSPTHNPSATSPDFIMSNVLSINKRFDTYLPFPSLSFLQSVCFLDKEEAWEVWIVGHGREERCFIAESILTMAVYKIQSHVTFTTIKLQIEGKSIKENLWNFHKSTWPIFPSLFWPKFSKTVEKSMQFQQILISHKSQN